MSSNDIDMTTMSLNYIQKTTISLDFIKTKCPQLRRNDRITSKLYIKEAPKLHHTTERMENYYKHSDEQQMHHRNVFYDEKL